MSAFIVFGIGFVLAFFVLYRYRTVSWYWHLAALLVAVGLGLLPGEAVPVGIRGYSTDLAIGFVILFLVVWGIGGLLLHIPRREKHA